MPTPQELEGAFWKALKSDMTMMLGLDGVEDGHARPMTAQVERTHGPIWFFTSIENGIVRKLGEGDRAIATFTSKGHDLFATVHGRLSVDNNRSTLDRLWNRYVPRGTRAARTILSWLCFVLILRKQKSGRMRQA